MEKKIENMTKSQLRRLLDQVETEMRELDAKLDDDLNEGQEKN